MYTYTYKGDDFIFNKDISDKAFKRKYNKLKTLHVGFLGEELKEFSKKCQTDFIEDDDYIKSIIGLDLYNEKKDFIDKINEENKTMNIEGFNYEFLYRYSIKAIKELITLNEQKDILI